MWDVGCGTGALIGGVSAAAFYGVGAQFRQISAANGTGNYHNFGGLNLTKGQIAGQIGMHATVGGISAVVQGGKFGHGFVSAGITKSATNLQLAAAGQNAVAGAVVAAAIGGTASAATGGKFANGAQTAAFQFLFNAGATAAKNAQLPKKTFFDGFREEFLNEFKEKFPFEYGMFEEYAKGYDMTYLSNDPRYYEIAWRGFESYSISRSMEILSANLAELSSSINGPGNALNSLPGPVGVIANAVGGRGVVVNATKVQSMVTEAMTIQLNGPQMINEHLWRESMGGRGYNPKLNDLVR